MGVVDNFRTFHVIIAPICDKSVEKIAKLSDNLNEMAFIRIKDYSYKISRRTHHEY